MNELEYPIMYNPALYQIPKINAIEDITTIITHNFTPPLPLLSLGFNTVIYDTKDKMSELENYNKRELNLVNRIDVRIHGYNLSLANLADKMFVNEYRVFTRAFYKLWEIITIFNLASTKTINVAGIAEAPASFQQAILYYRKMYGIHNNEDHYHIISLDEPESKSTPKIDKGFIEKYKKNVTIHQTDGKIDNGDVLKKVVRDNYVRNFKDNYANLITADGGAPTFNESRQEQEMFSLILGEATLALRCQAEGGHFVLKTFENFTLPTCQLIAILKSCYQNVFIHKPLTSHDTNSERYVVCHRFKYKQTDKELVKLIGSLEDTLINYGKMITSERHYVYITDLGIKLDDALIKILRESGEEVRDLQVSTMENMVSFMHHSKGNAELKKEYDKQVSYTELWSSIFFQKQDKNLLEQLLKAKLAK